MAKHIPVIFTILILVAHASELLRIIHEASFIHYTATAALFGLWLATKGRKSEEL